MKKYAPLLLAALFVAGAAVAQGIPTMNLPVPSSGSTSLSYGDKVVIDRNSATYGVTFSPGGACPSSQYAVGINSQAQIGTANCATIGFNNLTGAAALSQIAGVYSNGQILIGNGSTGQLQMGYITGGANITVNNTAGGIQIVGGPFTSGVTLGTSASATNPSRSGDVTTGMFSPIGSTQAWAIGATEKMRLTSTGLGIGTTVPGAQLTVDANTAGLPTPQTGSVIQIGGANGAGSRYEADAFAASAYYSGIREDGTPASPAALNSGDEISGVNAWGYNGSAIVGPRASFRMFAAQNWTTSNNGTYADIATVPLGTTTLTEVAYFGPNGYVGIGTNNPLYPLDVRGLAATNGHIANGSALTVASGCGTIGSVTGAATTGSFTGTATSCAPVFTLPSAPNGWWCDLKDITHPVNFTQTAKSATSCTMSATITSGDTMLFHAEGY